MINKQFYWKSKCFQGKGLFSKYMICFYKYIIYIFPVTNSAYIKYIEKSKKNLNVCVSFGLHTKRKKNSFFHFTVKKLYYKSV